MNNAANAANNNVTPIAKPTHVRVPVNQLLPTILPNHTFEVSVKTYAKEEDRKVIPAHTPNMKHLTKVLKWANAPRKQSYHFYGPTGSGKTSFVYWLAAVHNEPVFPVQMNSAVMPADMEGFAKLKLEKFRDREMVYRKLNEADSEMSHVGINEKKTAGVVTYDQWGLVPLAYKYGGFLLLDEADKINSETQNWLQGLLEGKPLHCPTLGVTIERHPMCRIILTGNTRGEGGSEGYHTSQRWDEAFRRRLKMAEFDYLTKEAEIDALGSNLERGQRVPPLALRKALVSAATDCRQANQSKRGDAMSERSDNGVIGTRDLVNILYDFDLYDDVTLRDVIEDGFMGSVDDERYETTWDKIKNHLETPDIDYLSSTAQEVFAYHQGGAASKKP